MPKKDRIEIFGDTYGWKKNPWQGKIIPRKSEKIWSKMPKNDGKGPYNKLFSMIASHPSMKGRNIEERLFIIGRVMKEVNRRLDENTISNRADIEAIIAEWTTKDLQESSDSLNSRKVQNWIGSLKPERTNW